MKFSHSKISDALGTGSAFYYPEVEGEHFLLSRDEMSAFLDESINPIDSFEYSSVLLLQTGFSTKEKENRSTLEEAIDVVERKLENEYKNDKTKLRSKYGWPDRERIEQSSSSESSWASSLFDVWQLNLTNKSSISVKVGHNDKKCYTNILYKYPSKSIFGQLKDIVSGGNGNALIIDRSEIKIMEERELKTEDAIIRVGKQYLQVINGGIISFMMDMKSSEISGTDIEKMEGWVEYKED